MCSGASALVLVLAAFQFWHWFRPSEPYLVAILSLDLGVEKSAVYNSLFPWSTYALLPATVLSAAVFEVFGFGSALLLAGVGDVVTVVLVIASGGSFAVLLASQVTFALSFAAVFTVVATLFALLPPELYQRASSYNRAASLLGTILSSLVGQGMADLDLRWDTLWGTLAGTSVSLVIITVALFRGVLRPYALASSPADDSAHTGTARKGDDDRPAVDGAAAHPAAVARPLLAGAEHANRYDDIAGGGDGGTDAGAATTAAASSSAAGGSPPHRPRLDDAASVASSDGSSLWGISPAQASPGRIADRLRRVLRSTARSYSSPVVLSLSLWHAGLRAAHTLALTYWQPLLDDLRPDGGGGNNGGIYAAAYACAAAAACLPVLFEWLGCCSARGSARGERGPSGLAVAGFAAAGLVPAGALVGMAVATAPWWGAVAFVLFHSSAEVLLVVASAWIGQAMVDVQAEAEAEAGVAAHGEDEGWGEGPPRGGGISGLERDTEAEAGGAWGEGEDGARAAPASPRRPADAARGPRRAGKGVYFAAVLGGNALLGMLIQIAAQAGVQRGSDPLSLRWQFAVFAGIIVVALAFGATTLVGARCVCRPSSSSRVR